MRFLIIFVFVFVFCVMNFPLIDYVINWKEHVQLTPIFAEVMFARNARLIISFLFSSVYSIYSIV